MDKKVVLITGSASGIGKATAELLIEKGHTVYGGDIQSEKNKYLEDIGGHSLDMDVTKVDTIKSGVEKIIKEQGHIDVLFNNAGFGVYAPVEETTEEDMRYQLEVNFFGVANVTRIVVPHMRKQKSGYILNTSSMGGKIYMPLGAWYHATKHAIEGWSDCLRLELKDFNIKVVIIEPGAIDTNFGNVMTEYLQKYLKSEAYKHMVEPYSKMTETMNDPKTVAKISSPPSVIAEVVNEAINTDKPKTRVIAGKMANMLLWVRKIGGDKVFDWFITRQLKQLQ
jgi:NAD(P)-dependent dehydrogenase (short-subunit alcohol dehydrogenase family)